MWSKRAAAGVALTVLAGGGVVVAGSLTPRDHQAVASVQVSAPIEDVWDTIRDFGRLHQWAPDVVALQRLDDIDGNPAWRTAHGETLVLVDEAAPHRLVVAMHSPDDRFGGHWTYELEPTELGTGVTLTEEGWVNTGVIRLFMHLSGSHADMVEAHTAALKVHLEG